MTEDRRATVHSKTGLKNYLDRSLNFWFRDLVVVVGLVLIIVIFLYQPVRVEGVSMMPRIHDQERIFINKFEYRFSSIRRGDVVVFSFPLDPHRTFIKRIIGLPGETVQILDGKVYINSQELRESYVPRSFEIDEQETPILVSSDHYYVMGDHRNMSNDSRSWGLVPRGNIIGKAVLRYWPLDEFGLIR